MTPMRDKKPTEDGDATYVFQRAEDRSPWLRVSYTMDKYKPIIYLAVAILIALGFGFKTPKQSMDEVKGSIDSVKVRVTNLEKIARIQHDDISNLLRLRCLDVVGAKRADECFTNKETQ